MKTGSSMMNENCVKSGIKEQKKKHNLRTGCWAGHFWRGELSIDLSI